MTNSIKPVFDGGIVVRDSNGRAIGEVYPLMDGSNTYGFLNYKSDIGGEGLDDVTEAREILFLNHKSGLGFGGAGDGAW